VRLVAIGARTRIRRSDQANYCSLRPSLGVRGPVVIPWTAEAPWGILGGAFVVTGYGSGVGVHVRVEEFDACSRYLQMRAVLFPGILGLGGAGIVHPVGASLLKESEGSLNAVCGMGRQGWVKHGRWV